jgi:hypothetical protein
MKKFCYALGIWVVVCLLAFFSLPSSPVESQPNRPGMLVEEADGSPAGWAYKLKLPNSSLALSGAVGTYTDQSVIGDMACNEGLNAQGSATNVLECSSTVPNLATTVMPSTDNTWSGLSYTANAGEAIVQWEVVYFDYTDNEWKPADADAAGEWPAWGVATAAGTDGNALVVLYRGCFQSTATTPVFLSIWSDAQKLYLSDTPDDTDCSDDDCYGWTDTAPATSGDAVQPLGHVIDTGSAAYICVDISHIHGWATVP